MTGPTPTPAPLPISAVIITRDAERHLAAVLAACACLARTGGSGCVTEQAPSAAVKATARAARVVTGPQGEPTGFELMQIS